MILKDFNLMKWIGGNSFRTSHYPYSELIMDEADAQGFIVINEVPAVGLNSFSNDLLTQHLQTIKELIERDKNRPSVFMWSIANEPNSEKSQASSYFEKVASEARAQDPSKRLITGASNKYLNKDYMAPLLDVVMVNEYFGWYIDLGYPQVILDHLTINITKFYNKIKKPIIISEYGAETIAGMHTDPTLAFSEDYQEELLIETHKAFDILQSKGFLIGEHIWNFADFMTEQSNYNLFI